MLTAMAAPAVICAPEIVAAWPRWADTTPVTSAGAALGVEVGLVELLLQASLTVMTQPASSASAASSVNSRRVGNELGSNASARSDMTPSISAVDAGFSARMTDYCVTPAYGTRI